MGRERGAGRERGRERKRGMQREKKGWGERGGQKSGKREIVNGRGREMEAKRRKLSDNFLGHKSDRLLSFIMFFPSLCCALL